MEAGSVSYSASLGDYADKTTPGSLGRLLNSTLRFIFDADVVDYSDPVAVPFPGIDEQTSGSLWESVD